MLCDKVEESNQTIRKTFAYAVIMAIYKQSPKRMVNFRQTIFWGFWGFLAGIYCCQPLLKGIHRDEKSILAEYIKIEDGKLVTVEKPIKK